MRKHKAHLMLRAKKKWYSYHNFNTNVQMSSEQTAQKL